jgi:hypothetical protein
MSDRILAFRLTRAWHRRLGHTRPLPSCTHPACRRRVRRLRAGGRVILPARRG